MRAPALAALAVASMTVGGGAARARPIETATFPIGPAGFVAVQGVAAGSDGTVVFVFSDDAGQTYTQWASASGAALAPALRITGTVGTRRQSPDGNGGSIVAYTRFSVAENETHLFTRRLDGMGIPVGGELRVDTVSGDVGPFSFDVAGLPSGSVFVWQQAGQVWIRLFDRDGLPRGDAFGIDYSSAPYFALIAARSDGGFAIVWLATSPAFRARVATFEADGSWRSPIVDLPAILQRAAIAGGADGGFAVAGIVNNGPSHDLVVRRYDADAHTLGQTVVTSIDEFTDLRPTIAADGSGNWHVVWGGSRYDPSTDAFLGLVPPEARPMAADGSPLEPAFELSTVPASTVVTTRLPSGSFLNGWGSVLPPFEVNEQRSWGDVISLCTPDIRSCGDGVLDGRCEECDAGAGNSDSAPDACRSTCRLPTCGDGTTDTGEACDDGNTESCDGCSASCELEVGLGCGDGLVVPGCAERCDDGNAIRGDGCTPACTLERVYGGGQRATDCLAEWVVDNPSNAPLLDPHGGINAKQRCVDGDPGCDFDGGVPGSCTFRVRVCGNNTDVPGCAAPTRLASWELARPSVKQAATHPALAAVRDAFRIVPGAIVGPSISDVCSDFVEVAVPLRGGPVVWHPAKLVLKARAVTYDGVIDGDTLALTCVPAS